MTNFKKQAFSVLAAGSLLMGVVSPVFASTTIQISGNGAGSDNAVTATQTNTTTVSQNNSADVTNNVTSNANTGNNDSNFNTGGNNTVKTGDATTKTTVTNSLNSNAAQVTGCNCGSDATVDVSGNGAFSSNQVNPLTITNTTAVSQSNTATVDNNVNSNANSGDNDANLNTGGSTNVKTGAATSVANVTTQANANTAVVGGATAGADAPSATFTVSGNGAGSTNWISATLGDTNALSQNNSAEISNDVNSNANSGDNSAKFNGGNVTISTGDAKAGANVDNMTNFNAANIDCGCTFDVLAKVAGNGASVNPWWGQTQNGITLGLTNLNSISSLNADMLDNSVLANADSGDNDTKLNTGAVNGDPAIVTGIATDVTGVNNSGNINTVGSNNPISFPTIPVGNTNVGVSFNVQALLAFFGLTM